jgi:hypothetical protein
MTTSEIPALGFNSQPPGVFDASLRGVVPGQSDLDVIFDFLGSVADPKGRQHANGEAAEAKAASIDFVT